MAGTRGEGLGHERVRRHLHIAIHVSDLDRSTPFYEQAYGAYLAHRDDEVAMLHGPGAADLIALERSGTLAGRPGGLDHFGIQLRSTADFAPAPARIVEAGGRVTESGDRGDDQHFAIVLDPDGNRMEVWWMNPP